MLRRAITTTVSKSLFPNRFLFSTTSVSSNADKLSNQFSAKTGFFDSSVAAKSVEQNRTVGITKAHDAENRGACHKVAAFADASFLRRQLAKAKKERNEDVVKRLDTVLRCYDEMALIERLKRGLGVDSDLWKEKDGVPFVDFQDTIGDMRLYTQGIAQQAWTNAIARSTLNLDKYPLDNLDSPAGQELVNHIAVQLRNDKTCFLGDFLRPEAVEACADLFDFLHKHGTTHHSHSHHNVYFSASDPEDYPADHPVNMHGYRSHGFIAGDYLHDEQTILKHIFRWKPFRTLIEKALNMKESIYCSRDPINQLVCNVQANGEQFPWHFDGNEYIITLTIREADEGGELWAAPDMRSPGDENTDVLSKFLKDSKNLLDTAERDGNHVPDGTKIDYVKASSADGKVSKVKTYKAKPGDLQFFMGRYCLHQITKVHGPTTRQVAIFAFSDEKNYVNPVSRSILNCGRAYPLHYEREAAIERDHF